MIAKFGTFENALAERYHFEQELGRGAMGTVYRAKDLRLGRAVAIKMLHPALTNELGVGRFESEVRIAARLHHQNIIAVHESGEVDGRLFYVMDYLGGETLRDRLKREKQLSIEDAIRITEQVAAGLQHAHEHGVVHRDIKPENIILAEGQARIVDFGIAIALDSVDEKRLTATGLSIGTPHYISPEQAAAEREIGPQADQYGLACVLFEMLAGEPPFTGPAASIIRRHITEVPPRLRTRRAKTPYGVDAAVARALEKVPADRFASVREFDAGLKARVLDADVRGDVPFPSSSAEARRRTISRAAIVVTVLSVAALGYQLYRTASDRRIDSSRILVFPPVAPSGASSDGVVDQRLRDAFAEWQGVSIPRLSELRDAMVQGGPTTPAQGLAMARSVRAGRFVLSDIETVGVSLRLSAVLFDATRRAAPRRATADLTGDAAERDQAIEKLVFELLFGADALPFVDAMKGTRSSGAMQSYLTARTAMRTWSLRVADSALVQSLRRDPGFAHANLALATNRFWAGGTSADVTRLATAAMEDANNLSATDAMHAAALRDLGEQRYAASCARYDSLTSRNSRDFAAWYGLADCHRNDDAVIPDRNSPSGFTFRASRHRATNAVNRAFDLLSAIDSCCVTRAVAVQSRHFQFTSNTHLRAGRGVAPDSTIYVAYPELIADTLAFVPYSLRFESRPPPRSHTRAVAHQRREFYRLSSKRIALSPTNADVLSMLAEAMELQGEAAAIDTVRRARRLSTSKSQALKLAFTEVWLRVKEAVPQKREELLSVRVLAESLLTHTAPASARDVAMLASLAALVGDGDLATQLAERMEPANPDPAVPHDVWRASQAFLVAAAVGREPSKMRELEARLSSAIANGVLQSEQRGARTMHLSRAAALAYPRYRAAAVAELDTSLMLVAAEAAHARRDMKAVRAILDRARTARLDVRSADLTLDALYPEAWLLAAAGDTTAALKRIGDTLDALPLLPVRQFYDPVLAGCLVQAMSLRADLLAGRGDAEAGRQWARAVAAITSDTSRSARESRRRVLSIAR